MGMACAPKDTHPGAHHVGADRNPLQDNQAPVRQSPDAFGSSRQGAQTMAYGEAVGESRRTDPMQAALVEAIQSLAKVTKQNSDQLAAFKASQEEAEKRGWRDRPVRETEHIERTPDLNGATGYEKLTDMVNDRTIAPETKLHAAMPLFKQWMEQEAGV